MPPLLVSITHNWRTAVRKVLGFRTEVIVSDDGGEQRRRLRSAPTEITSYVTTLMDTQDALAFRGALYNAPDLQVDFPQWEDELDLVAPVAIGATTLVLSGTVTNRHFAIGSRVLLFREGVALEVVTLDGASGNTLSVAAPGTTLAWPANTLVVPIGRILAPVSGTDLGDVLRDPTISIALDEDIAGVTDGGELSPLVCSTVTIRTAAVGFRDDLARGAVLELYVEALTADGLLIPNPVVAWSYTGDATIVGYESGKQNSYLVRHDGSAGAAAGTVEADVDGVIATLGVGV
jgi:hypothetical protein